MPAQHTIVSSVTALSLIALAAAAHAQQTKTPTTDEEKIADASSAAPAAIGKDASVIVIDEKGQVRTLRKGTNGFTCIPDDPSTPIDDPMCVDPAGLEWTMAWINHKDPPKGKVGFGYMFKGEADINNDDPYATAQPGQVWLTTGPHVMIFNLPQRPEGYPTQVKDDKDRRQPYIMWPGTPYEHLMIPVQ
jgi:hypothetical protein